MILAKGEREGAGGRQALEIKFFFNLRKDVHAQMKEPPKATGSLELAAKLHTISPDVT